MAEHARLLSVLQAGTARRSRVSFPVEGDVELTTAERLLAEAASLFRERGYAQATTRELGRRVGIAGPSLYYHFKTKEDLLFGICNESLRRLAESVMAIERSDDPVERLRRLITTHMATILRDRNMHATMLVEMRALTLRRRRKVVEGRDAYSALVQNAVADAQNAGAVRRDVGAHELTLALLNMLNWTIFWYRDDGELAADDLGALYADLFLSGALVRS